MGTSDTGLTWGGFPGALSNADHDLHLIGANGYSLCKYAPAQLRPVTRRDFKANGELRQGSFCQTCRERGMNGEAAPDLAAQVADALTPPSLRRPADEDRAGGRRATEGVT
jgi:hypothetical protein